MPWLRRALATALLGTVLAGSPFVQQVHAQDDDWEVKQNPFDPRIVNRYKALLEKNPNDAQALKRLIGLYSKYSTLDKLIAEYEAKHAKKPDSFAFAMILGHLHRHRQEVEKALGYYEKAAKIKPEDGSVNIALAELYRQAQKIDDSIAAYEKALAKAKGVKEKKAILRVLADLSLQKKDIAGARRYYAKYIELDPKDVRARMDLGDALAKYDMHAEALVEYQAAEKAWRGDAQQRVNAMAAIGRELQALGRDDEAVAIYRQAIGLMPRTHHLRRDLTERIIEIFRKKQDLRGLIAGYEKEWPAGKRGFFEWDVLARLYEEVGEQDKALEAYRKAVKAEPYELDTQRRMIALLDRAGRDDEVIAAYEAVIRVAPGEPRFQIELAERYMRRGDKAKALDLAKKIAGRFPDDPGVHGALADLYSRWGEEKLALKEYEILVKIEPQDDTHLVNLGEQYFQRGEKDKAIEIWKRIIAKQTPESYARLAEIYAEHDMPVQAIEMYKKAIAKRDDALFHKGLASVYERQRQEDRAIEEWETVKRMTAADDKLKPLRREARTRIIAIYHRRPGNPLPGKATEWERKFRGSPDKEIESGYDAAEAFVKLTRYENAEQVLLKILDVRKDDGDALHQLVAVYKNLRRYSDAIVVLKRLADLSPGRERDYYNQIAELEFQLSHDEEAVKYALLALEKSKNDPAAYEKLAEIYEKRGEYEKAVDAYKKAIAASTRNYKVYFSLARLQVFRASEPGITEEQRKAFLTEAAKLYREVIRRASDEDTVRSAARKGLELEQYMGTLGQLEAEIAPLAFTYANKPVYRRVLVELYALYVPPLVAKASRGDQAARKELTRLGEHGLKPLLEALGDDSDPPQQRIAVQVLGHLGNKNAAPPLVKLAQTVRADAPAQPAPPPGGTPRLSDTTDGPDMNLRVEALVSAGRLGDPRTIPALIVLAEDREAAIKEAAVWALGRTRDAKAVPALLAAAHDDEKASVQALACLGLGRIGDKKSLARAAQLLRNPAIGAEARAACAHALGAAGAAAYSSDLIAVLGEGNDEVQRKAAWALGRLGDKKALPALLRAYFSKKEALRQTMAWAIVRVHKGTPDTTPILDEDVSVEAGKINYRALVKGLTPDLASATVDPAVLKGNGDELAAGVIEALGRHRDVVLRVLRDLDAREDSVALGALTAGMDGLSAADKKGVEEALGKVSAGIVPALEKLADARDPEVRALALAVLAKTGARSTPDRLVKALSDADQRVRTAAMESSVRWVKLGGAQAEEVAAAVAERLSADDWQERLAAADALGRLGQAAPTAGLVKALGDSSAFVRQAGARALGALKRKDGVPALLDASKDESPEVRLAVVLALKAIGDPRAKDRLAEMARSDPDEAVQAAAAKN
jgi:HEAT repeat protein/tetratricopeptide (TPR) repeat protein